MKIIDLPVRVYESGDRVSTTEGYATVIHDELDGIKCFQGSKEELIEAMEMRAAVIVRLDEPTSSHPVAGGDVEMTREEVRLLEEQEKTLADELLATGLAVSMAQVRRMRSSMADDKLWEMVKAKRGKGC